MESAWGINLAHVTDKTTPDTLCKNLPAPCSVRNVSHEAPDPLASSNAASHSMAIPNTSMVIGCPVIVGPTCPVELISAKTTSEVFYPESIQTCAGDGIFQRKSDRDRKEKRSYSPDTCSSGQIIRGQPVTAGRQRQRKSRKQSASTIIADRPYDKMPDGRPFSCDLCKSSFVCNPLTKRASKHKRSKHMPSPRHKVDPSTGKVLLLCNACGLAFDPPRRPRKIKVLPTAEEKAKYIAEEKAIATALVEEFQDPDCERLFCPSYKSPVPCQCIQNHITGNGDNEQRCERIRHLLEILKEAKELSTQKFYNMDDSSHRKRRNRNIGLGNGHKRSAQYEDYVMLKRTYLKTDVKLCELGTQKILKYSNNFLHKKLKTDGRRYRAQRVKGKAALGCLYPITQLVGMQCCVDKCVRMALTHSCLLQQWRDTAVSSQKEARKVLAEMLTPSGGARTNCYKFIAMVTGCSPSTIGCVNEQMKRTGGNREPPTHGLKDFWQHSVKRKRKAVVSTTSADATDATKGTDVPGMIADEAEVDPGNKRNTVSMQLAEQKQHLLFLQKQLIEQQLQLQQQQQIVQHQLLQQTLLQQLAQENTPQAAATVQQILNQLLQLQQTQQQVQLSLQSQQISLQNSGQPISSLQNSGQPISSLQNSGQRISNLQNSGQPISSLQNSDQPIVNMQNSGQPISSLQSTSQPISSLQNSSQPINSLQNSGQSINSLQNSGQPISSLQNTGQPINSNSQQYTQPNTTQNQSIATQRSLQPTQLTIHSSEQNHPISADHQQGHPISNDHQQFRPIRTDGQQRNIDFQQSQPIGTHSTLPPKQLPMHGYQTSIVSQQQIIPSLAPGQITNVQVRMPANNHIQLSNATHPVQASTHFPVQLSALAPHGAPAVDVLQFVDLPPGSLRVVTADKGSNGGYVQIPPGDGSSLQLPSGCNIQYILPSAFGQSFASTEGYQASNTHNLQSQGERASSEIITQPLEKTLLPSTAENFELQAMPGPTVEIQPLASTNRTHPVFNTVQASLAGNQLSAVEGLRTLHPIQSVSTLGQSAVTEGNRYLTLGSMQNNVIGGIEIVPGMSVPNSSSSDSDAIHPVAAGVSSRPNPIQQPVAGQVLISLTGSNVKVPMQGRNISSVVIPSSLPSGQWKQNATSQQQNNANLSSPGNEKRHSEQLTAITPNMLVTVSLESSSKKSHRSDLVDSVSYRHTPHESQTGLPVVSSISGSNANSSSYTTLKTRGKGDAIPGQAPMTGEMQIKGIQSQDLTNVSRLASIKTDHIAASNVSVQSAIDNPSQRESGALVSMHNASTISWSGQNSTSTMLNMPSRAPPMSQSTCSGAPKTLPESFECSAIAANTKSQPDGAVASTQWAQVGCQPATMECQAVSTSGSPAITTFASSRTVAISSGQNHPASHDKDPHSCQYVLNNKS